MAQKVDDPAAATLAGDSQIVFIGETHFDRSVKDYLRAHLQDFKEQGFTHLALEMLNASNQHIADNYRTSKGWDEFTVAFEKDWHWPSETYFAVLTEAARLGLKIVALDGRDVLPEARNGTLAALYESNERRDRFMAERLSDVLRSNPKARILAWTGAMHAIQSVNPPFQTLSLPQFLNVPSRSYVIEPSWGRPKPKRVPVVAPGERPPPAYFRAAYLTRPDAEPTALVHLDRAQTGWDGIIIWELDALSIEVFQVSVSSQASP
jgi:hypothetical protein